MSTGSIAVVIACVAYLGIVVVTTRGFIVAPRARKLRARAEHIGALATVLGATAAPRSALGQSIATRLQPISRPGRAERFNPLSWIAGFPLTKVAQYSAVVADAAADLIDLVPDEDVEARWATTLHRLQAVDPDAAAALADAYAAIPAERRTAGATRVFVHRAQSVIDENEAVALDLEFDRERVAFWLAAVGLVAVAGVGFALGHELSLLVGALGGFLAPVVTTLTSKRASIWGVMVLSPVGGALTAVGGLLLARFLADLGLLGTAFAGYWDTPGDPRALALALLFGFSGRLFSRLAISAASQVGSDQPAAPEAPPGGEAAPAARPATP